MFEVYAHTSPSGKTYVGFSSNGMAQRWREHVQDARRGRPFALHAAIRKHGPAMFTSRLLERLTTEAGARRAEQLWIKELGTLAPGGYNLAAGGGGCSSPSAETRERMAASHRGKTPTRETRAKMSAAQAGRQRSPEGTRKSAEARRGAKRTPEQRARIAAGVHAGTTPGFRSERSARAATALWATKPRCTLEALVEQHRRALERGAPATAAKCRHRARQICAALGCDPPSWAVKVGDRVR